jgi:hypothetical protein
MTEQEWLASTNWELIHCPNPPFLLHLMLECLRDELRVVKTKHGRRKLRLFACACCRRYWPRLSKTSRSAIELAERLADGKATRQERWEFQRRIARQFDGRSAWLTDLGRYVLETSDWVAAIHVPAVSYAIYCKTPRYPHELWDEEFQKVHLIHDIFGNPFRPVTFDSVRFTAKVVNLAKKIYDTRTFHRLPVLADALEEAGCTNAEILNHCRGPGPHAKGCWVLDWYWARSERDKLEWTISSAYGVDP